MNNYIVSVDWLQVCCFGNLLSAGTLKGKERTYEVQIKDTQTAMFCHISEIKVNNLVYATVQQEPRSSALKKGLTILKLSNRVLYSEKYIEILYELINLLHLSYKGITRIDLCYDCNKFYCGRNIPKFLKTFVTKSIEEVGGIYRKGSTQFSCHGSRTSNKNKITSISFGSPQSNVRAYIYDKTLELQEVKDKPWIRKVWEMNGLKNDEKNHVWRAEISIKCEGQDLLNMSTGELFRLSPKYVEHYENIKKIFHFYAKKYFDFRENRGQKNSRNFSPLWLFDESINITCKPKRVSVSADTGRMERIVVNKLEQLATTYTDLADSVRDSLYKAQEFIYSLSTTKLLRHKATLYKGYLSTIMAHKFLAEEDFAYLEALDEARQKRREIEAEYQYELFLEWKKENRERQEVEKKAFTPYKEDFEDLLTPFGETLSITPF